MLLNIINGSKNTGVVAGIPEHDVYFVPGIFYVCFRSYLLRVVRALLAKALLAFAGEGHVRAHRSRSGLCPSATAASVAVSHFCFFFHW